MVLRRLTEGFELVSVHPAFITRQVSFVNIRLDPGCYVILPRTTGSLLGPKLSYTMDNFRLITGENPHPFFKSVVYDIFA